MNDEDIKKSLVCCLAPKHDCSYCLLEKEVHCTSLLHKNILALINRQQAEIERLESLLNQLFKDVDYKLQYIYELEKKLESDQAEAIKNFAEKVVNKLDAMHDMVNLNQKVVVTDAIITVKQIAKEMAGEQNA